MKKNARYVLSMIVVALLVGCAAHRANPTNPIPISAFEQTNYLNAQISIHNRAAAQMIVAINQAGFLETEYFDRLSAAQVKITRAHKDLTPLLKDLPTALANQDKVKALLDVIQNTATGMISDGTVGVKNPQSQQALLSDVASIRSAAASIYTILEASGAVK